MNLYSEYSDQTLVVLIVSNDQRAFAEIYRRYWDKMFVVAFNRLRDQFEAEETVQEIFVKLWTRRTELQITQNLSSYFAVAVKYVLLLFSGCFEDRKILFNHQVLEWQPPNRATNALTANVNFDTDETNTKTVTLKIQYAGAHVSHNINAVFDVHTGETTAVEGQHFRILGSKTLIIPPNSSESNSVTIEILGASFENGENKRIVLRISDDSDYDPMVNYRDFVININKKAEEPGPDPMAVVSVTMDRPGTNSNTKRMLDVITGTTYSFTAANDDPSLRDVVDFAIFRGASAGLMLISTGDKSPGTSEGLGRFTGGRTIRDEWQKKNDGDFMRLPSTKGGNQSIFDVISTESDILATFTDAENWLNAQGETYDPRLVGPGKFLQERVDGEVLTFKPGDLILFKSLTRDVYMVALVINAFDDPDDANNRFITFSYKRAIIKN